MKVLKYFKAFFIHVLQLCTYYYSLNYYQLKYSYMKNLFRTFVILFLAIVSTSCSNDNDDFRFDSESLKQTT